MQPQYYSDGLPPGRRTAAIATIVLGLTMSVMDSSIANVSLPTIARDLNATASDSIWVINAYQIALAVCMLPLASLGEVFGYRRVYLGGLTLFTIASFACAASHTLPELTVARSLQGLGAAGVLSVNAALVRFIYPVRMLGRAVAVNALVAGASSALGPTVAGMVLSVASWQWLFFINLPAGLAALVLGYRALPWVPLPDRRYDLKSALVCIATVGLLLFTGDAYGHGQATAWVAAGAVGTAISCFLLMKMQSSSAPMLPVDLLRIPVFGLSICTSICSFAAQAAALIALPFFFQEEMHLSPSATGLLLTPWPVAVALTAPFAGRLSDRISSGLMGGVGMALMCIGLILLTGINAHTSDFGVVWRLALCGFGFGLFQSPNNRTILGTAPSARVGAASGMLGTGRLVGQTVGAAFVAYAFQPPAHVTEFVLQGSAILAGCACVVSTLRVGKGKPA